MVKHEDSRGEGEQEQVRELNELIPGGVAGLASGGGTRHGGLGPGPNQPC